jgi:hypothetical protein
MQRSYLHSLLLVCALPTIALLMLDRALAQPSASAREDFWTTDGSVNTILVTNGVAYIGGSFNSVGPRRSFGAILDRQTGEADPYFPKVLFNPRSPSRNGVISAIAPDGSGGWFIGGTFTNLGGLPRNGLAHVFSDGTVDSVWNPAPELTRELAGTATPARAILLWRNQVYVAGSFTGIGGFAYTNLAALDAVTGEALDWAPNPNGRLSTMAIDGDTLYVAGSFRRLANQDRDGLAAFDLQTGNLTSWNPWNPSLPVVNAIAVSGGNVYVAGSFTNIGGHSRSNLAALSAVTGVATEWNPAPNGPLNVVAVSGPTVYAGGRFTHIGGMARNFLAALDANTGLATPWNPDIGGAVIWALQVTTNAVYIAGGFQGVNGAFRRNLAAVDALTGQVLPWNPNPIAAGTISNPGDVTSLAVQGSKIFVGGNFLGISPVPRANVAALDAETGALTEWNPSVAGNVYAFTYADHTLYMGGNFTNVSGQPRSNVAAVRADTGTLLPWAPQIEGGNAPQQVNYALNYPVSALAISSNTVFIGGTFTMNVGGLSRRNLAAVDAVTGIPTALSPDPGAHVSALVTSANLVYVGGFFGSIGGQSRSGGAAIELPSGNLTSFNPSISFPEFVLALAIKENVIFVGGYHLNHIFGNTRRVIAFDVQNSNVLWDYNPGPPGGGVVNALAVSGDLLYVGGMYLGALNYSTGQTINWSPSDPNIGFQPIAVQALAASGETVFVGGPFQGGLAVYSPPGFVRLTALPSESGSFGLRVGAAANEAYVIQCSSNLVQWSDVATNSGAALFKDLSSTQSAPKFYRAFSSP